MGTTVKHPVPDRVKPSFVIFDIRALWRLLYSVWHRMLDSRIHMVTVGVKELTVSVVICTSLYGSHRCDKRLQRLQIILCNAFIILSTFISIKITWAKRSKIMTDSQAIVHCVRIGHRLSSLGHGASDGKQLPHDGAASTEQTSRQDDWA